ncbi:MAG: dienelactone hydrolase family protein [Aeromicrobium sp.]
MTSITVPGGTSTPELGAYVVTPPSGAGPWPGVVVLHEALGLNRDTREQADRVAAAGYVAVAPDLFSNGGAMRCLRSTFATMFRGEGPAFGDIEATRAYLADRDDCTGAVGVVGFCMGGGFALLAATRGFDASAPNYGALPKNAAEVLRGACPIVASYGARDLTLRGAAAKLDRALDHAGVVHDVKEYPGVGHSFMNDHRLGPLSVLERVAGLHHDAPTADQAWQRIFGFFDEHLT